MRIFKENATEMHRKTLYAFHPVMVTTKKPKTVSLRLTFHFLESGGRILLIYVQMYQGMWSLSSLPVQSKEHTQYLWQICSLACQLLGIFF